MDPDLGTVDPQVLDRNQQGSGPPTIQGLHQHGVEDPSLLSMELGPPVLDQGDQATYQAQIAAPGSLSIQPGHSGLSSSAVPGAATTAAWRPRLTSRHHSFEEMDDPQATGATRRTCHPASNLRGSRGFLFQNISLISDHSHEVRRG